jgi:predicted metal-dependent phosphoesterase TrpH
MPRRDADGNLWWKVDFHLHSAEDPFDRIEHSAAELVGRAGELGFDAIAITLHGHVLDRPELFALARSLGVALFPAIEFRIGGADVVAVNIRPEEAAGVRSFGDLRSLRERRGEDLLVFVPHPFYLVGGSIGGRVHAEIDCFDAVEYCHFHTGWLNPNRRAVELARQHGKPLLATSDAHRLGAFGSHYSWVQVPENPSPADLFRSIRQGRVEPVSPPWPTARFLGYLADIMVRERLLRMLDRFAG